MRTSEIAALYNRIEETAGQEPTSSGFWEN